jgi:hypothetical protein
MSAHGGGLPRIANKYEKQRAGRVKESAIGDEKKGAPHGRKDEIEKEYRIEREGERIEG